MAQLTTRAKALLGLSKDKHNEEHIYRQVLSFLGHAPPNDRPLSEELASFIRFLLQKDVEPVLYRYLELAREHLNIVPVEVVSAVELSPGQLAELERRLAERLKKTPEITARVDPSLLGGLRIRAGDVVVDTSIKKQLHRMRESMYEGVLL